MKNLVEKIKNKKRLNYDESLGLYELDLYTLGSLANERRIKLHGNKVFYNLNRHINPSNLCADTCKFCAFSAHRKNEKSSRKNQK